MNKGSVFLAVRMAVYVMAVPFAIYLGGTFNPETGDFTFNIDRLLDMIWGLFAVAGAWAGGRVAKANGAAT